MQALKSFKAFNFNINSNNSATKILTQKFPGVDKLSETESKQKIQKRI